LQKFRLKISYCYQEIVKKMKRQWHGNVFYGSGMGTFFMAVARERFYGSGTGTFFRQGWQKI